MVSYSEIIAQIEDLKRQAEKQRKEEYGGVLKTIKRQIAEYGISAEDLGFSPSALAVKRAGKRSAATDGGHKPKRKASARGLHPLSGKKVAARYRDQDGNSWTGRGKKPRWLTTALAAGATLDSFRIHDLPT